MSSVNKDRNTIFGLLDGEILVLLIFLRNRHVFLSLPLCHARATKAAHPILQVLCLEDEKVVQDVLQVEISFDLGHVVEFATCMPNLHWTVRAGHRLEHSRPGPS